MRIKNRFACFTAAEGVARFEQTIGPEGKIEKAITASRLEGQPDFSAPNNRPEYKPRDKSKYPNKKRDKEKRDHDSKKGAHKSPGYKGKSLDKYDSKAVKGGETSESVFDPHKLSKKEKAKWKAAQAGSGTKTYEDGPAKKGKKPHKKKLAAAAKRAAKGKSTDGNKLKRKKRK